MKASLAGGVALAIALVTAPATAQQASAPEIAPGVAIAPLDFALGAVPSFIAVHDGPADTTGLVLAMETSPKASGLLAFGVQGPPVPGYDTDIMTGTVPNTR